MRLNNYLHSQLSITFFPIFLGLFFITSVVFLVKIASLTSVITMNFYELLTLFSYSLPQILFYTLPITFFISLAISVSKLSSEYELTVITSFGLNPLRVIRVFLPVTILVSTMLLVISLGLIPKTEYLRATFLDFKKKEANFNIKESEFGQKFGDWLIYISGKDGKIYKDVKLFKTEKDKEQFIISKEAHLLNQDGNLSFRLDDGKVFIITSGELNQIDYKVMHIYEELKKTYIFNFTTSYNYWKVSLQYDLDTDSFLFYILTSFFPLISLFLVIVFGYFNPRYEKNRTTAYAIVTVIIYYVLVKYVAEILSLHSIYIIPTLWIASSYLLYSRTIKKEY